MSRAKPKRKRILLGVGKYYNPAASAPSLKHNARVLFLEAVENKAPEVLHSLHQDVWPFYESVYWRVSPPQSENDWRYTIHPGLVGDWFRGRPVANWTARSGPALTRLKKALYAWASHYHIFAEWTIMYALDTMMFWAASLSFPDRRRVRRWLRRQLDKELPTEGDTESRSYGIQQAWGIDPKWYFEKRELRRFEYPNWQGEEEHDYRDRVHQEFELHLQGYMSEIRNRGRTLPKIPKISKPERFEMLALYLCRGMNREQIAGLEGFSKDVTVIYRDIREAAQLISLPLRPRGRPQKKLQEEQSK